jgi:hypothetical protein
MTQGSHNGSVKTTQAAATANRARPNLYLRIQTAMAVPARQVEVHGEPVPVFASPLRRLPGDWAQYSRATPDAPEQLPNECYGSMDGLLKKNASLPIPNTIAKIAPVTTKARARFSVGCT